MSKEKVSRRGYAKYAAAGIVVVAVAGAGAYYASRPGPAPTPSPSPTTPQPTTPKTTAPTVEPTPTPMKYSLAQVQQGSIADHGWGTYNYEGIQRVEKELSWETAYTDLVPPADWETVMRSYADKNFDMITLAGAQFEEIVVQIAPEYPNVHWMIVGGYPRGEPFADNVGAFDLKNEQAGYLCGILAAGMSKSNIIGIMSAVDYPNVVRITEAYKLGAQSEKPNIEFKEVWTGDWADVAKSYEAASTMIDQDVDVIYQFLDEATAGVTTAIKEKAPGEVYHIGTNKDQYELYPEGTLTSIVQRIDEQIVRAATMVQDGTWKGGYYNWGFEEGIVYLAPYHGTEDKVPQELKDKITQTQQDIMDGKIEVPRIDTRTE